MPKNYYAVAIGRKPGVYTEWSQCQAQVKGFPECQYKKFATFVEAQEFVESVGKRAKECDTESSDRSESGNGKWVKQIQVMTQTLQTMSSKRLTVRSSKAQIQEFLETLKRKFDESVAQIELGLTNADDKEDVPSKRARYEARNEPEQNSDPEDDMKTTRWKSEGFHVGADGFVDVYTDGAASDNGRANCTSGIGVWWADGHKCNVSKPCNERKTNNAAEIYAAIEAIKIAKIHGIDRLRINTDSAFMINCMTKWINNWKRNNWIKASDNSEVKNRVELQILDEAINEEGFHLKWNHVRGHRGVYGNERADELARAGSAMQM